MIVRLMGDGQFRVADDEAGRLNEIDDAAVTALDQGDEAGFRKKLEELHGLVQELGEPLDLDDLSASDVIVPPSDLSLDEAREFFSGEGLVPDLPT